MNNRHLIRLSLAIAIYLFATPISFARMTEDCYDIDLADTPSEGIKPLRAGHISAGDAIKLSLNPDGTCSLPVGVCEPVFVGGTHGVELKRTAKWVCVALPGKRPIETWAGWVPLSRWQTDTSQQKFPVRAWVGVWQNERGRLNITEKDGRVIVDGHAIWQGISQPRFGDASLEGVPIDDAIVGGEVGKGCQLALRRIGEFIFAQDNNQCGSPNVRFDGLYRFRPNLKPDRR